MSWKNIALSEVAEVFNGKTPSKDEQRDNGYPVLKIKDVSDESRFKGQFDSFVDNQLADKFNHKKIKLNDTLILNAAHNSDYVGSKQYCAEKDVVGALPTGEWLVARAKEDKLHSKFLNYWLGSSDAKFQIKQLVKGIHLYPKDVARLEIPLPPLTEQKRIAAILDKADSIRRKRQQAIKLADEFLRAVFLDMFGDLVTQEGYLKTTKSKISEALDYIDYRGKTPEKSDSGVALITAKNVRVGYVDDEPREYIPEENYLAWMTRGFPKENDVLFTTEAPMGNVALLGRYEKVALGQRLIALRSKGSLTHEYLMYLLLHPFIQTIIYSRSSGSTVRGIRTKELFEIEIPIPSLDKQEKFSKIYRLARKHINQITAASKSCETLFDSLSSQAFGKQ